VRAAIETIHARRHSVASEAARRFLDDLHAAMLRHDPDTVRMLTLIEAITTGAKRYDDGRGVNDLATATVMTVNLLRGPGIAPANDVASRIEVGHVGELQDAIKAWSKGAESRAAFRALAKLGRAIGCWTRTQTDEALRKAWQRHREKLQALLGAPAGGLKLRKGDS
jgi:hypothetical protein